MRAHGRRLLVICGAAAVVAAHLGGCHVTEQVSAPADERIAPIELRGERTPARALAPPADPADVPAVRPVPPVAGVREDPVAPQRPGLPHGEDDREEPEDGDGGH